MNNKIVSRIRCQWLQTSAHKSMTDHKPIHLGIALRKRKQNKRLECFDSITTIDQSIFEQTHAIWLLSILFGYERTGMKIFYKAFPSSFVDEYHRNITFP